MVLISSTFTTVMNSPSTQMNKIREEKWDIMRGTTQFQWIIMEYFENLYDHKLVNTEKYIWEYMFIKIESKDI